MPITAELETGLDVIERPSHHISGSTFALTPPA
jgi:hypothetical protein